MPAPLSLAQKGNSRLMKRAEGLQAGHIRSKGKFTVSYGKRRIGIPNSIDRRELLYHSFSVDGHEISHPFFCEVSCLVHYNRKAQKGKGSLKNSCKKLTGTV